MDGVKALGSSVGAASLLAVAGLVSTFVAPSVVHAGGFELAFFDDFFLKVVKQQIAFRSPAAGSSAHQQVHFVLCHSIFLLDLLLTFNIFVINRDNSIE